MALTGHVWVAIVETNYEAIGVATTEGEAVRLAQLRALQYLEDVQATRPGETDTVAGIAEWFAVSVTRVPIGGACMIGLGES